MLTVGVYCRTSGCGVVALEAAGDRQFNVKYRGSSNWANYDLNDGLARRAAIKALTVQVRDLEPGNVWVDVGALSQETRTSILVGQTIGALSEAGFVVYEVSSSTWQTRLRVTKDSSRDVAIRHLGQRVGRNENEDIAAAVAYYGATAGHLAALRERKVSA